MHLVRQPNHFIRRCMSETPASAELLRLERARLQHANVHLERSNLELREALRDGHDPDLQLAVEVRCSDPRPPPPSPPALPSALLGMPRADAG